MANTTAKIQPYQEVVGTLKTLFPDAQVELRNNRPTLWSKDELDSTAVFSIASVASENKMSFTLKRSGDTIRVILK